MPTSFAPFPNPEALPIQSGYASRESVRLSWELIPNANGKLPVLLIMGFLVPGHGWRFVRPHLGRERAVLSFDNRGSGLSDKPKGPYDMACLSEDALFLADCQNFERFHVVGVSMGGMIAQHLALKAPSRVASLTLIATHAGGLSAVIPPLRGLKQTLQSIYKKQPENEFLYKTRLLFPKNILAHYGEQQLVRIIQEDFEPVPPQYAQNAQFRAILGHNTRKKLDALKHIPTLIIKPREDALVAPRHSEHLHRLIPDSKLQEIENAGHGVIRQEGEKVAKLIMAHIDPIG